MKKGLISSLLLLLCQTCFCWGFFGHKKINELAVYLLPPEMMVLYKPNISFLVEHAVDPDKRRYILPAEAPRHYIDMEHFGKPPFDSLPLTWKAAVNRYTEDSLNQYGIVPWWLQTMLSRLTNAFAEKDQAKILRCSAEIGHYIADSHVPLHATRNHNGQYTGQRGIHGFWESRIPELLADKEWDFFIGKAQYIKDPVRFIWARVFESAAAADTVLTYEKELSRVFPADQRYAFEMRDGRLIRQYSTAYSTQYNEKLKGMIERRMRQSIYAVACFWYTAWINAGQPDLSQLVNAGFSPEDLVEFEQLNKSWKDPKVKTREHE